MTVVSKAIALFDPSRARSRIPCVTPPYPSLATLRSQRALDCAAGGPGGGPWGAGGYWCATMEGSFETSYLLSRQTAREVEGTDSKTATPPAKWPGDPSAIPNLSELPLFQCWPGNSFFVKTRSSLSGHARRKNASEAAPS
jgi:hypothetical protein